MKKQATWMGMLIMLVAAGGASWYLWANSSRAHRLMSSDPSVSEAARQELLQGKSQSVSELREWLSARSGDWQKEAIVLQSLEIAKELGPEARALAPEVVALMTSDEAHVRELAAQVLPAIEVPASDAVPALIKQLERWPNVPALRALSLYVTDAEPAAAVLQQIMERKELSAEIRWNAARTLGKSRAAAGVDSLVAHLNDEEPTVREHAAEALGDIGPAAGRAAASLVAVLTDDYVKVRRDAVRSLGQISPDPAEVIPAIKPLLEDPEEIVRDAAKTALERLQSEKPSEMPSP